MASLFRPKPENVLIIPKEFYIQIFNVSACKVLFKSQLKLETRTYDFAKLQILNLSFRSLKIFKKSLYRQSMCLQFLLRLLCTCDFNDLLCHINMKHNLFCLEKNSIISYIEGNICDAQVDIYLMHQVTC